MEAPRTWTRLVMWSARLAWVAAGVAGSRTLDVITADWDATASTMAALGGAVLWLAGVAGLAVASTLSLTIARVVIPMAVPVAVVMAVVTARTSEVGTADIVSTALFALVATAVVASPEFAMVSVQASAYGDEQRFPLRPPVGYLAAAAVAWVLVVGALLMAALMGLGGRWVSAGALGAAGLGGGVLAWPRWHQLSRRWLVFVPAGLVVHDPVVLADTVMLKRSQIAQMSLALAHTEAFDLTGPAAGHALEVATTESVTVVCRAGRAQTRAVHLTALLVAPSRPGRALRAATARVLRR